MLFSKRLKEMKGSPTVLWDMRVREAMLENPGIINLTVGQPDWDMPKCLIDSIEKVSAMSGVNKYANPQGEAELRSLLAEFLKKFGGFNYSPEEIIWTSTKEVISLILAALMDKEDEIIIIVPCWPTYVDLVRYYEGKPVFVEAGKDFHLDLEAIESAISKKTKAIIINTPNNPTGAVYNSQELKKLSEIVIKNNLCVISDEVYRTIVFDGHIHQSISVFPGMRERTIVADGFSKSLAVPGLRMGFALGEKEVIQKMKDIKSNVSGNSNSLMQFAMIHAFRNYSEDIFSFIEELKNSFEERRNFFSGALVKSGIEFAKPEGTFYLFIKLPPKIKSSMEFAQMALKEGLGISPGVFFEKEGYARVSFAAKKESLEKASETLSKILSSK